MNSRKGRRLVSRLDLKRQLHRDSPRDRSREDRRPLRVLPFPAKNRLDTGSPRLEMKSLGQDVCELLRGVDSESNQAQVTVLVLFVGEVLPDVHVLGTLWASDDIVTPLKTGIVVQDFGAKFAISILRRRYER
jgi:hypothetical protein